MTFLSYRIFTTYYNYRIEYYDKINIVNGERALHIWLELICLSFMPVQVITQSCNLFLKKNTKLVRIAMYFLERSACRQQWLALITHLQL